MHLLEISPVTRGSRETLSYFSSGPFAVGSVVHIPLRSRQTAGIVLSSRPIREEKALLKKLSFRLKKIPDRDKAPVIPQRLFHAFQKTADYFATSVGAVVYELVPVDAQALFKTDGADEVRTGSHRTIRVEGPLLSRVEAYSELIRQSDGSAVLIAPTHEHARRIEELLKPLSPSPVFRLPQTRGKNLSKRWQEFLAHDSGVFIGTRALLTLPREDISLVIVEECAHPLFKERNRPYIDARIATEHIIEHLHGTLVWGDSLIPSRFEGNTRRTNDMNPKNTLLIDMVKKSEKEAFRIFSEEAEEVIRKDPKSPTLVFTPRTGLYPLTSCRDCGTVVTCPNCQNPLVLHEQTSMREFRCHRCRRTYTTNIRCKKCDSVQFDFLGIGIQAVEKEVRKIFPEHTVFILDDLKASASIMEEWRQRGGILIAHEPVIPLLPSRWPTTVILTLDTLFAIPDIGMEERIARLITELRHKTEKTLLVQTRNADKDLLSIFLKEESDVIHEHLRNIHRQTDTPPAKLYIRLSWPTNRPHEAFLSKALKVLSPLIYESWGKTGSRSKVAHALVALPPHSWPNQKLLSFFRALPPDIAVDVEPISIL